MVISVTVRAYPDERTATARLTFGVGDGSEERGDGLALGGRAAFLQGVEALQALLPSLHDVGCSSEYTFNGGRLVMPLMTCYGLRASQLEALLLPLEARLESLGLEQELSVSEAERYSDTAALLEEQQYTVALRHSATWLISRHVLLDERRNAALVDAVLRLWEKGAIVGSQSFELSTKVAADANNAVFPGWRSAALLFWIIL